MRTALLSTAALVLATTAHAAEVAVGPGVVVGLDMPDKASGSFTRFGPGPGLHVPVWLGLASHARLRITARAELGVGTDRVSWSLGQVGGEDVRVGSSGHWAMVVAGGLTAGPEIVLPVDGPVAPYLGAEMGVALLNTYHSFGNETAVLLDPRENDLNDPRNVDPFTSNTSFMTDVHAGAVVGGESGPGVWFELGYAAAFVPATELKKAQPSLAARREAFGWNPVRLGAGVRFSI